MEHKYRFWANALGCVASASFGMIGLSGCTETFTPVTSISAPSALVTIQGSVHGGQQPVAGASIQLYVAGSPASGGATGAGSQGLITGTLPVTDQNGSFNITGLYGVPAAASHFYIVSTGGSPGFGNPANPDIVLMAALGGCTATTTLSPTLFIDINEVTTVATVAALNGFIAPPAGAAAAPAIGASSSMLGGLQSSFEGVNNLVNTSSGSPLTHANNWAAADANGPLINTLADILAYCVNSDPTTTSNCNTLFADSRPSNTVPLPFDTAQAAWYVMSNPGNNASSLFGLVPPNPPFVALTTAPSSFALTIPATGATACQVPVPLATASNFDILGFSTVTNTGSTTISGGNVGLSPGTSVTGFPPGVIASPGVMDVTDSVASQAQTDLTAAYNTATGLAGGAALPSDISGLILPPGLYVASNTSLTLNTGTLTLDAQGDSDAVFIFQIGSTLTTGAATQVKLVNGAQAKNVFWAVGGSATLGTSSSFAGDIMAKSSVILTTGASLQGRALANTAAVTLDTNTVTAP
jgi:hypothetical protein